jgi:hypothetical protein
MKGVSDLSSIPPETSEPSYLAVGRHAPGRNAAHHSVHAFPPAWLFHFHTSASHR